MFRHNVAKQFSVLYGVVKFLPNLDCSVAKYFLVCCNVAKFLLQFNQVAKIFVVFGGVAKLLSNLKKIINPLPDIF